jgi:hypothetical protein
VTHLHINCFLLLHFYHIHHDQSKPAY